jgi:hypothetical protein
MHGILLMLVGLARCIFVVAPLRILCVFRRALDPEYIF